MNAKKWVKENVVCLPKSLDELTTLLEVHHVDVSEEEAEERYEQPEGVSNKCQCKEDHGWTTVMACNQCGFICDPVWQEKSRPTPEISEERIKEIAKKVAEEKGGPYYGDYYGAAKAALKEINK